MFVSAEGASGEDLWHRTHVNVTAPFRAAGLDQKKVQDKQYFENGPISIAHELVVFGKSFGTFAVNFT